MPIDYIPYLRKKVGHDKIISIGLTLILEDGQGRILMERRKDNGLLCFPGGSIDLDEKVKDGVIRETYEETGVKVNDPKLFLLISGEEGIFRYPNGDVTEYVDLYFYEKQEETEIPIHPKDQESTEIFWAKPESLLDRDDLLRGVGRALRKYLSGDLSVEVD